MSPDLEWGDPPKPRDVGYQIDWSVVMAALLNRPGEWAKITELPTSKKAQDLVRNLKDGRYKAVDPNKVEVVARTIHGGRGGVWMRVVKVDA